MRKFFVNFLPFLVVVFYSNTLSAQVTRTFNYSQGVFLNDWDDALNWSPPGIPGSLDNVIIPSFSSVITPRIYAGSGLHTITNLTINGTMGLAIEDALVVTGVFTHTGSGTFIVERNGGRKGSFVTKTQAVSTTSGGVAYRMTQNNNTKTGYRNVGPVLSGLNVGSFTYGNGFTLQGTDGVDCYYNYSPYPNVQVYRENHPILVNGDYNERWVSSTNPNTPLVPGKGYAIRLDAPGTFESFWIGGLGTSFNNALINIPVTNTVFGTGQGWNFLSNPYPSSLVFSNLLASQVAGLTTGISYVFATTDQYKGTWGSVNSSGVTSGFGSNLAAPSQGFYVQANSNANFQFDNNSRTSNYEDFFKTDAIADEVRLKLDNGTSGDEIVAYTEAGATVGHDNGMDATKFVTPNATNISFLANNKEYAINALPTIDATTQLPLSLLVNTAGTYTLKLTASNTPNLIPILKDLQTGNLVDLSTGNATLSLPSAVKVDNRYVIVFSARGATGIVLTETSDMNVFANGHTLQVNRTNANPATITVYNVVGQKVASFESNSQQQSFELSNQPNGSLIIHIAEGSKVSIKKIVVIN